MRLLAVCEGHMRETDNPAAYVFLPVLPDAAPETGNMMKVYGSEICIDCREFKRIMAERGFEVDYVDITENTANLRAFLQLRDHEAAFDAIKTRGGIGIPAFVKEDGEVTLDLNTALGWIGQEPVEETPVCDTCK